MSAAAEAKTIIAAPTGHRFTMVDLSEMGDWMAQRIVAFAPHKHAIAVRSWLIGCMTQNDMLFARAGGGVCLVQRRESFLTKSPWAELVFALARPGREVDASGLFQDIRDWCERLGCTHIVLSELCDVERADISLEIETPKRVPGQMIRLPLWYEQEKANV